MIDSTLTARYPQFIRTTQDWSVLQAQVQYLAFCEYQRAGRKRREILDEYHDYWNEGSGQ